MGQLLIRNIDDDLKQSIRLAAARNNRSMQAEVLAALEERYKPESKNFVEILLDAGKVEGPGDFQLPERHRSRPVPDFS